MRPLRSRLQIIFQDPSASLNPRMRVRDILANGRDRVHEADTPQWTSPQHAHVRGPGDYQ